MNEFNQTWEQKWVKTTVNLRHDLLREVKKAMRVMAVESFSEYLRLSLKMMNETVLQDKHVKLSDVMAEDLPQPDLFKAQCPDPVKQYSGALANVNKRGSYAWTRIRDIMEKIAGK